MDTTEPIHISYKLLEELTDGFSEGRLLGRGTFGEVYRGEDSDGHLIAVKRLLKIDAEDTAFRKEFKNLTKLKHPNITRLVGFCSEDEEVPTEHEGKHIVAYQPRRVLCFEYMENGSLEKYIADKHKVLVWREQFKIIKGICEGLKYLHTGLEEPIHHLDLKPDNILLDKNMMAKVADFGISRLVGDENTKRTFSPTGTLGYLPPEFVKYQIISKEFDIFSLGVILLKIMIGPSGYSLVCDMKPDEFARHVYNTCEERLHPLQGHKLLEIDCQQVKKCIEIALKCIDEKKSGRPDIGYIVDQLNQIEKPTNDSAAYTMDEVGSMDNFSPATDASRGESPKRTNPRSVLPTKLARFFLEQITNNFSEEQKICESIFGAFYKGILPDGSVITVKKLGSGMAIDQLFESKVTNLMAFQHENIGKLVAFCNETRQELVECRGRKILVDIDEQFLCYEYLPKGPLDMYIFDESKTFDWDTRFNIIKGICSGLHFLHNSDPPLIHMYISPTMIWLDDNWVPRIMDCGLSRLFRHETRTQEVRQLVYLAPEYKYRGEISTKADIYSLGMLIINIITGERFSKYEQGLDGRGFLEKVIQNWMSDDKITSNYPSLNANSVEQLKACIEIASNCVDVERRKRPSTAKIIDQLSIRREVNSVSTALLEVYPAQLPLPSKPNRSISCSLQLTNKSDDYVAVRVQSKMSRRFRMPLFGIVPPLSTYTLIVRTRESRKLSSTDNEFVTLESVIVPEGKLHLMNADTDSSVVEYGNFFKNANETDDNTVHELTLPVVSGPLGGATPAQPSDEVEIISNDFMTVLSVDVHQKKPWIMTSDYGGNVVIWNYKTQEIVSTFKITKGPVYSAKFIARESWFVAGDHNGTIYVYNYNSTEHEEMIIEEAHDSHITSLAVHHTYPLVLSSSDDHLIKLWDWNKNWMCTQTFEEHSSRVSQVDFNPIDTNSFASASLDHTVKIWNFTSSESKITLSENTNGFLCVQHCTSGIRKYLIAGSWDGTAYVWDLETKKCVQMLKGHANRISSVYSHPNLPIIITGSRDGTVRLWSSTSYRLERIIGVNLGAVFALGYIEGLRRIVVGCDQGVAFVEINFPGEPGHIQDNRNTGIMTARKLLQS